MFIKIVVHLFLIKFSLGLDTEKLAMVQVIFRHGDRTPSLKVYPNDPYKDVIFGNLTAGQLTNPGKSRQYALGQWLRYYYNGFLSKNYYSEEIRIVSDETDRCLQSAASTLAGLYPLYDNQDISQQHIPIHINPLLFNNYYNECPYLRFLIDDIQVNYKSINEQYKQLFQYVQENSGQKINDYRDLYSITDTLYLESELGLTLPEWTKTVYPNPLVELSAIYYGANTATNEIARVSNGPLYKELLDKFEDKSRKFQIYSGHDSNILNLVNIMTEHYEPFLPEFSSMIIFELWENPKSNFVKMFLKRADNVEQLYIKGCGYACEFGRIKNILKTVSMSDVEKVKICGIFVNK